MAPFRKNTAIIVVDTNKPSYTECEELLKKCKTIVVLDHHRQGTEAIENATLSYVEPFASSACEMVAEIIQYISDTLKIRQVEETPERADLNREYAAIRLPEINNVGDET